MISSRQRDYLEAMGIEVWNLRDTPIPDTPAVAHEVGLKLGPGKDGILLICAVDSDSASRLASDISRAMGSLPVWAWPHADTDAVSLPRAIEDNLFTTVAIFGEQLAGQLFNGDLPAGLHSANLVLLPSMQEIQDSAKARQLLWTSLCRSGMVSAS